MRRLQTFFEKCKANSNYWNVISDAGLQRIYDCYTWKIYAKKLINLTNIYGYWKHISKKNRREIQRYMKMFYTLKYQNLVKNVPISTDEGSVIQIQSEPAPKLTIEDIRPDGLIGSQSRIKRFLSSLSRAMERQNTRRDDL